MGVAVVMVEKRPSGAEKEPRRGDLSPDRGGRGRAAASNTSSKGFELSCRFYCKIKRKRVLSVFLAPLINFIEYQTSDQIWSDFK